MGCLFGHVKKLLDFEKRPQFYYCLDPIRWKVNTHGERRAKKKPGQDEGG